MKTMLKLVMLLAVLAICMPAQGEILIYSKAYHCWEAWQILDWNTDEWTQRGYLVLDVSYDENGEIDAINDAEQIEFERDGRDKFYWQIGEEYIIERVDDGDEVIWVLEQLSGDGEFSAEIVMLKGKARARFMNIGLGRDEQREVARVLDGYWLYLSMGMGVDKQMCTKTLRLQGRWTKLANDPEVGNQDFEFSIFEIVKAWLELRGYEEPVLE